MSKPRPPNMPPNSWLFASGNGIMAGRSALLAGAGPTFGTPPGINAYGPLTLDTLIAINADDSGDGLMVTTTAQLGKTSGASTGTQADVLLKAEWGNAGSPNYAYMKLGNGVVFSVPANYYRLIAQNLAGPCQVIASASPYPGRGNLSAPHYSFQIMPVTGLSPASLPVFRNYDYYADPNNFTNIPLSTRNYSPAPFIIPPFADTVSVYVSDGIPPSSNYALAQYDSYGNILRVDNTTADSGGNAAFQDVELAAETVQLSLQSPEDHFTSGVYTFDFKLAL